MGSPEYLSTDVCLGQFQGHLGYLGISSWFSTIYIYISNHGFLQFPLITDVWTMFIDVHRCSIISLLGFKRLDKAIHRIYTMTNDASALPAAASMLPSWPCESQIIRE